MSLPAKVKDQHKLARNVAIMEENLIALNVELKQFTLQMRCLHPSPHCSPLPPYLRRSRKLLGVELAQGNG